MTDEEGRLLDEYIKRFDDCYPTMILGVDADKIRRCLELNIQAEELYADMIKPDVLY